eukprot:3687920-Pyramimonas_sp.AAC.1
MISTSDAASRTGRTKPRQAAVGSESRVSRSPHPTLRIAPANRPRPINGHRRSREPSARFRPL